MAKYVFSDPHFYSENIIRNCHRPFATVEEMNARLITNYNSVIEKHDICYWLGDIMYAATQEKVRNILSKLHGRKWMIMGNHDRGHSAKWWRDAGFDLVFEHPIYIAEEYIILSHEPLTEFGHMHPIANIHGHTHDYNMPEPQCVNVCVEQTNYRPVPLANPFIKAARVFQR